MLKKKARRVLSISEGNGAIQNLVNQSVDGRSLGFDGVSPAIGEDDVVKKRNPKPFQLLDDLPVMEDKDYVLFDVFPVVEDEYIVKRKSASPSTLLSPMVAIHTIVTDKSSLLPFCFPNTFSTCMQAYTVPPSSYLFDNEWPLSSDKHCLVKTQLGPKNLKRVRDGINIESGFSLVAPRLKRKTRSK